MLPCRPPSVPERDEGRWTPELVPGWIRPRVVELPGEMARPERLEDEERRGVKVRFVVRRLVLRPKVLERLGVVVRPRRVVERPKVLERRGVVERLELRRLAERLDELGRTVVERRGVVRLEELRPAVLRPKVLERRGVVERLEELRPKLLERRAALRPKLLERLEELLPTLERLEELLPALERPDELLPELERPRPERPRAWPKAMSWQTSAMASAPVMARPRATEARVRRILFLEIACITCVPFTGDQPPRTAGTPATVTSLFPL